MGSAVLPPHTLEAMSQNMVWDGLFHAATWVITLIGVFLLWREARAGTRVESAGQFTGQLIFGWGAFNLVEGIIDHHLIGIHHVRDVPEHIPMYDWLFLGVAGVGLLVVGWMMMGGTRQIEGGIGLATTTTMATPNNDSQNPLPNDDDKLSPDDATDTRQTEAEDRAAHGQSLAKGDTGGRGTGVNSDAQGISNRPGDTSEDDR